MVIGGGTGQGGVVTDHRKPCGWTAIDGPPTGLTKLSD
jgi:hypothetical protein